SAQLGYYYALRHDGRAIDASSELTATLFDALAVGLERIEVSVRNGVPEHFAASGVLQLPLLNVLLGGEFGLEPRPGGAVLHAGVESLAQLNVGLGPAGSVDVAHVALQGDVAPESLALAGQIDQMSLSLGALSASVASAALRLNRTPALSELTASLGDVD